MEISPNLNFRADVDQATLEPTGIIVVGTALGGSPVTLAEAKAGVDALVGAIQDLDPAYGRPSNDSEDDSVVVKRPAQRPKKRVTPKK